VLPSRTPVFRAPAEEEEEGLIIQTEEMTAD
jgi:hypothetical protein